MRTYDDDVRDVLAVQAGDEEALMRLLAEYKGNLRAAAKKFDHRYGKDDANQIAMLAFIEYVGKASELEARRLRKTSRLVALNALNEAMSDGLGRTTGSQLRAAAESMRPSVESAEEPLSLYEAADRFEVGLSALDHYVQLSDPVSYDTHFGEGYDPDNPYAEDAAGGATFDEYTPEVDPEFMRKREAATSREAKCQSIAASALAGDASPIAQALDALAPRQREVMLMLANGMSETDIAAVLGVAFRTVVNTRVQATKRLKELLDA